jgi:hypothetical protein
MYVWINYSRYAHVLAPSIDKKREPDSGSLIKTNISSPPGMNRWNFSNRVCGGVIYIPCAILQEKPHESRELRV